MPSFIFTYNKKDYVLAGNTVYFSAVNLPATFNDPNATGNGFVQMSNQFATSENLAAMAPFQGKLAFFTRHTTQVWNVDANPANWSLSQMMNYIGTMAPASVQPIGDFDVFFLSDSGIRSLRVLYNTLNAFINDVGSPVDQLVQADLVATGGTAACASVEPSANRYWLYLNGNIYVLSYFPSSKIIAWSQYVPSYKSSNVQVTFTPQKFEIFNGQIYARDTTQIYVYGGVDNNQYDNCTLTAILPFVDVKTPGTNKVSQSIDFDITGLWTIYGSMDIATQTYEKITQTSVSSFDSGAIEWKAEGTHWSVKAVTSSAQQATLGSIVWHYQLAEEK